MKRHKDKVIKTLRGIGLTLHDHLEILTTKTENQEQYSGRNCLLVHRINENKYENTDELVLQAFNTEMSIDVKLDPSDQTHRHTHVK